MEALEGADGLFAEDFPPAQDQDGTLQELPVRRVDVTVSECPGSGVQGQVLALALMSLTVGELAVPEREQR